MHGKDFGGQIVRGVRGVRPVRRVTLLHRTDTGQHATLWFLTGLFQNWPFSKEKFGEVEGKRN